MSWPALVRVCEKSPARCSWVGTVRIRLSGVRLFERSTLTKKNVRFFLTGPPSVNPYCLMSSLQRPVQREQLDEQPEQCGSRQRGHQAVRVHAGRPRQEESHVLLRQRGALEESDAR